MDDCHVRSAEQVRQQIEASAHNRFAYRAALLAVPPRERDAWLDRVLGLGAPPDDDEAQLPRGCVPYLPCGVDALIEVVDRAKIGPTDLFVDIGSGVGRAMALVHLLTDATAIGIEIQSGLVETARGIARLVSPRISNVHGNAVELTRRITTGSVFFLYCPFSGEQLQHVLTDLESIARTRPIRICCVDLPLPDCAWLAPEPATSESVMVYRSTHVHGSTHGALNIGQAGQPSENK